MRGMHPLKETETAADTGPGAGAILGKAQAVVLISRRYLTCIEMVVSPG